MKTKKKPNILIYLGLLIFVIAPFVSYLLTPSAIRLYCDINPTDWCGLKMGAIIFGGIFFTVLLLGITAILIATAPKKKS